MCVWKLHVISFVFFNNRREVYLITCKNNGLQKP